MRKFEAFPRVRNLSVRQELQARILSCERILTLKSFHRDTILLEGCYQPMRHLFPVEETTLQNACEASFRHDSRYFRANYIDLWLHVMRNHPYLSDHSSAKPIKDGNEDKPVYYLKSEAEVSRLASFAASRGFWTFKIGNLLLRDNVQMQCEPVCTKFPKLSCKKGNIQRNNRYSRPRACDFEQEWKHLSLQNVFQAQKRPSLKYPTAFAVIRDIIRCFWGSVTPGEIDNPRRILQVHQYMEQHNDLSGIGDELQDSSCQIVIAVDSDPMQGTSQDPAKVPRPASSIYSDSGRSPLPPTSPRYRSTIDGEVWSGEDFVESYRRQIDVPSTEDGAEGHVVERSVGGGSSQANEPNGEALMLLSSDTRSNSPASTEVETPIFPLQAVQSNLRGERIKVDKGPDRAERADETLHEIKKAGHRGNPHRIEKPQHYTQKKKLKQQQTQLTRALRDHDDDLRPAVSQTGHVNLFDTERKDMKDISNEVEPHNAQSRGGAEQSEVLCTDREPFSGDHLSDGEAPVTSSSESAIPQLEDGDTGVKAHSSDAEQDMQRAANQWCSNDGDDDVQTATRKAEEQMRGADDAVGEVHDDSPAGQTQQSRGDEIDGGINSDDTVNIPTDTMSDIFPGGSVEPATDSSVGHREPIQTVEVSTGSERQTETSEENTSRRDKRRAIYHGMGSVDQAGNGAIPWIQATASHAEESDTAIVSGDAGLQTRRPSSMFPGRSLVPDDVEQVTAETHSSSHVPPFSKKRNFPNESEGVDVQLRSPKNSNQAQLNSWEPFKEIVDSIRRIWSDLDHARIYVTSPIKIEELSAQQLPNQQRLWSWLKEDKELFDRQIGSLLRKKFGFQVVYSDAHWQPRQYCSLDHMEYWNAYFGSTQPRYWLAVLTPWRVAGSSREKVRKTCDDEKL